MGSFPAYEYVIENRCLSLLGMAIYFTSFGSIKILLNDQRVDCGKVNDLDFSALSYAAWVVGIDAEKLIKVIMENDKIQLQISDHPHFDTLLEYPDLLIKKDSKTIIDIFDHVKDEVDIEKLSTLIKKGGFEKFGYFYYHVLSFVDMDSTKSQIARVNPNEPDNLGNCLLDIICKYVSMDLLINSFDKFTDNQIIDALISIVRIKSRRIRSSATYHNPQDQKFFFLYEKLLWKDSLDQNAMVKIHNRLCDILMTKKFSDHLGDTFSKVYKAKFSLKRSLEPSSSEPTEEQNPKKSRKE